MGRTVLMACFVVSPLLHGGTFGAVDVDGVKIELADAAGPATVRAEMVAKHNLRIDVDPRGVRQPLTIRVQLPISGRGYWPAEDVVVVDASGEPIAARHNGTAWEEFTITVPPVRASYTVRAVQPKAPRPRVFPEEERSVADPTTGVRAKITNWYNGRRVALCLRFDDSHPTHLSTVIPLLRQYRFRATFMINPGTPDQRSPRRWRSAYQEHKAEWEAVAREGDQEFANHTAHHRGAADDEEMEHEIGDAAKVIWSLFPHRSKLLALNLGGGTWWVTKRPLRYYLDKYPSFLVTGSLGMDDTYGNRVAAFRQHLERNLAPNRLGWCKVHFHSVGKGAASSEENFRAVLEIIKQHESQIWIAGLADAYKYLTERRGAKLSIRSTGSDRVALELSCTTNPELFDHPLTIDVGLPEPWARSHVVVTDVQGNVLAANRVPTLAGGETLLRFNVPPTDTTCLIERR
ncbi:MAG TPA: hypothetical protein EYP56_00530 [Planctomycetaceae bacterium]|nr:hypothetical protein [Planctomycetaceae bacterium]